jgi:hypothetical protein
MNDMKVFVQGKATCHLHQIITKDEYISHVPRLISPLSWALF